MKADLHIHSRYSDGGLWPEAIARAAAAAGLEAACVTDHDTLGGAVEFSLAAGRLGLRSWPAVEMDCTDDETGYRSEMLAYFPDGSYAATDALLSGPRADRARLMGQAFERAAAAFGRPDLGLARMRDKRASGRPEGSPPLDAAALRYAKTDLFLALRDSGLVGPDTNYRDFKKDYFDGGPFSDLRFAKPSVETVARTVLEDGGVLVIPHIGHEFDDSLAVLERREAALDGLLARFWELGARGVELYDYRNKDTKAMNRLVREAASRFGYFHTYGSDCHGPGSGRERLGHFYGDFGGFPGTAGKD